MAETSWLAEDDESDDTQEGTPIPYEDPDLTAELTGEQPPEWLGLRWRDIAVEDQPEAWVWLRRWVDWFTEEYHLTAAVVPECWFQHSDTCAELYAAMCLEQKVWESEAPTVAPVMYWQSQLPSMFDRLKNASHKTCVSKGEHSGAKDREFVRKVDESAWQRVMSGRSVATRFDRPTEGTRFVRAVLEDENGTALGRTNSIGLEAHPPTGEPSGQIRFSPSPGELDELVHLSIEQGQRVALLNWEESRDQENWRQLNGEENDAIS